MLSVAVSGTAVPADTTSYTYDAIGQILTETKSTGFAATYTYDAFGAVLSSSGAWQGSHGYAGGFGYQEDAESGLKLLGHRYYDSSTGRFLSRDPIKDGRNWYAYCNGNPVTCADPEGTVVFILGGAQKNSVMGVDLWFPPGYGIDEVDQNINWVHNRRQHWHDVAEKTLVWDGMGGNLGHNTAKRLYHIGEWVEAVGLGNDWDYKLLKAPMYTHDDYADHSDDFGNFNYGATAAAAGLSDADIKLGAAAAQTYLQNKKLVFPPEDNPDDLTYVELGIKYYRSKHSNWRVE